MWTNGRRLSVDAPLALRCSKGTAFTRLSPTTAEPYSDTSQCSVGYTGAPRARATLARLPPSPLHAQSRVA